MITLILFLRTRTRMMLSILWSAAALLWSAQLCASADSSRCLSNERSIYSTRFKRKCLAHCSTRTITCSSRALWAAARRSARSSRCCACLRRSQRRQARRCPTRSSAKSVPCTCAHAPRSPRPASASGVSVWRLSVRRWCNLPATRAPT